MEFTQATRHIVPLLKFFAIIPYDISGPSGQRRIQKNWKCFILGNIVLASILCFLLSQLVIISKTVFHLKDLISLLGFSVFFFTFLFGLVLTLRHHHQFIQIYHQFIQISDCHPNCRKFFTLFFYIFIFKNFSFTINLIFENILYYYNFYYNKYPIVVFLYTPIEIYQYAFISYFQLILISALCVFKALNSNLLNFEIHLNLYNQIFNLLEEFYSIFELNLLINLTTDFIWIVESTYRVILSIMQSNEDEFITDFCFQLNMLNYFFQYTCVSCFLVEQLKREVRS